MELMNFVKRYDNVIGDDYCKYLIEKFEENTEQYETIKQDSADFTQIHLHKHPKWNQDVSTLLDAFKSKIQDYKMQTGVTKEMWPGEWKFENIRMKRYLPNDKEEFRPHVDVNCLDNAARFMVFFLYLDDNEGGMTTFPLINKGSPCKRGSLLMFPPLWPWLHAGTKPIDKPKYIIGSYLHYV